jgi:phosphate butyryltransferase
MIPLNLDQLIERARALPVCRMVVAAAHERQVLRSVEQAQKMGVATAVLIGDAVQIEHIAVENDLALRQVAIEDQPDERLAAEWAMAWVREGKADMVVKGQIKTSLFLRAALDREHGIRDRDNHARRLLSHVGLFQVPSMQRLFFMSDSGVVLYPTTMQKLIIMQNVIHVAHRLGLDRPRVAILAANEHVHPARPTGIEALLLARMASEGWIEGAIVDGPMPLDVALDPEAARRRGIGGEVAGRADVVIVASVEAGNIAAKAMQYLGRGEMAGLVVGARVPILINSRADDATTRLRSVAMAALVADRP